MAGYSQETVPPVSAAEAAPAAQGAAHHRNPNSKTGLSTPERIARGELNEETTESFCI